MKKLIVYTNFDKESEHALNYGIELALQENYRIELLHVVNTAHYGPDFMATGDDFTGGAYISTAIQKETYVSSKQLRNIKEKLRSKYPQLPEIHNTLKSGIDTRVIINETSKKDVSMLIFPDHNKKDFLDFIIDIGPEIISHANCPVLIIPYEVKFRPIKTIVYATDYEKEDISAIKKLVEFAKPLQSKIIVVHFTENPDFGERIKTEGFIDVVKENVSYDKIEFFSSNYKNIEQSILEFSDNKNADIIAILKENKNLLERIFEKSVSRNIVKNSNKPVLVFH